jgi:putative SOS response-associated peptidase YedK
MCGRFALKSELPVIIDQFSIDHVDLEYSPNFNVTPSQDIAVVVSGSIKLIKMRWGLIPFWAKDEKIGYKMINARVETLEEKNSYKNLLKSNRCIIVADGFYEWKKTKQNKKPFFIHRKDKKLMGFAGLYTVWKKDGKEIESCTIITQEADEFMKPIHDRMPLILKEYEQWLKSDFNKLLLVQNKIKLDAYEVSTFVNSPKNNSIECLNRV